MVVSCREVIFSNLLWSKSIYQRRPYLEHFTWYWVGHSCSRETSRIKDDTCDPVQILRCPGLRKLVPQALFFSEIAVPYFGVTLNISHVVSVPEPVLLSCECSLNLSVNRTTPVCVALKLHWNHMEQLHNTRHWRGSRITWQCHELISQQFPGSTMIQQNNDSWIC